jgi:glucokinase
MKQSLLGLDIGGTKCAVIYGETEDDRLTVVDKTGFPTETNLGLDHTLEAIYRNIEMVIDKNNLSNKNTEAIGISCGGPLNSKTGMVMSPPNLPGWDNVPLVSLLTGRYGIPAALQNDANACALAEWKFGAGKGTDNMIFMTFGTGLGAGLILNGRLYAGTNDMAGEVGHIRLSEMGPAGYGKSGSFEGFCSGGGIAQLARNMIMEKFQMGESVSFCKKQAELNDITAQTVAEAAMNGDDLALRIFRISGEYLGKGLSILIDILNPQMIVIGSIYARSGELLEPYAMEIIKKEALSHSRNVCRIVPAMLGEDLGDYAALSVAADLLKQNGKR